MASLIIPYTPRDAFKPYHANSKRFSVTVAHRRAGKTVARLNRIIKEAVQCERLNPRYGYIAPFYVQAKEIAWQYLKHYTAPLAPLGVKYHEADLCITFGHNNATIRLYGAENAERMRGLYFDGIAPDEAQGISSVTLRTVILPCLADRQGWLDISGTPKGWNNLLGEVVKIAQASPDEWFLQILKASETGILPESELAMQRKLMSDNEYAQEYECSFDAAITGAVYGKEMAEIQQSGRIKPNLYDPKLPVYTAWDLGNKDKTAIWFWQRVGMEVRLIDFTQDSFVYAPEWSKRLKDKAEAHGYKYEKHYLPHDAVNELQAAGGKSFVEQLHQHGIINTRIVKATSELNQHNALSWVMKNMWIDSKCEVGIQCLREFRYKWNDDLQTFGNEPRRDHNKHAADAAEIIGQVLRKEVQEKSPPKPRFLEEMTYDEIFSVESSKNSTDRRV
jgi:hypothetical protein